MFRNLGTFAPLALCLFALAIVMGSCGPPKQWTGGTALLDMYSHGTETWIQYHLSKPAEVTITIQDPDGNLVRKLELGHKPAGNYEHRERAAQWDGLDEQGEPVPNGTYFYTLTAGAFKETRKIILWD